METAICIESYRPLSWPFEGRQPAHNLGEKRQKDTGTAVDLSVSYEDYIACKDILARYNA